MNELPSVNAEIKTALKSLDLPVVPSPYIGSAEEYITFQVYSDPTGFADDEPTEEAHRIYLEYYCPLTKNSTKIIKQIKGILHSAGFGWPSVTPAHTEDKQHFMFECEISHEINFKETEN